MSSKIHLLVDGQGRPLVTRLTAGHRADSPVLPLLLEGLRIPRVGPGRPRTRPDAVIADKAYCARAHRQTLRRRGIDVVIPQRADQIASRVRRGQRGGRPPSFDEHRYKRRNVVERAFNTQKQWRGLATRYDKHATIYRGAVTLSAIVIWTKTLIGDTP